MLSKLILFIFPLDVAIHPTLFALSAFIIISLKFTSLIFAEEFEITPIFCCDDESILIFSKFIPTSEVVISFMKLSELLLSVISIFFKV